MNRPENFAGTGASMGASMLRTATLLFAAALSIAGCDRESGSAHAQPQAPAHAPRAPIGDPILPHAGPLFPENQVRLVDGDPRDTARLANVEVCAECHADVVEAWRSSPHARASFDNPWYRQAADAIREER